MKSLLIHVVGSLPISTLFTLLLLLAGMPPVLIAVSAVLVGAAVVLLAAGLLPGRDGNAQDEDEGVSA